MLKNKGFTLIEISIVIVIIGLIVGGIISGKQMIHFAGAKSVVTQITNYNTAVSIFFSKYNALPGDFINATSFIPGNLKNGNGDGALGLMTCSSACPSSASQALVGDQATMSGVVPFGREHSSFWHHLSLSGLLNSNYIFNGSLNTVNTNMPPASNNNLAGIFAYNNAGDGINYYHLGLSSINLSGGTAVDYLFLSPSDAFYIDNKMDDGLPASGIVAARGNNSGVYGLEEAPSSTTTLGANACVVGSSYATSTAYNVAASIDSQLCELRIRIN
jgi:prepilin-type N-terminal cleavage/methylation domain-containing protein